MNLLRANVNSKEEADYIQHLRELSKGECESGAHMFAMIDQVAELTPTEEELQLPHVQEFLRLLTDGADLVYQYVTPTPYALCQHDNCVRNVNNYIEHYNRAQYLERVFGFIIFYDAKFKFIRANAHMWLRPKSSLRAHHGVPEKWIDPSPLLDHLERGGNQLLLESPSLFTNLERMRIARPLPEERFRFGNIVNMPMVEEKWSKMYSIQVVNHYIGLKGSELRLCTEDELKRGHSNSDTHRTVMFQRSPASVTAAAAAAAAVAAAVTG
jgi:hypothetical protein